MMTPIPAADWQRHHSRTPSNREMASVLALAMSGAAGDGVLFRDRMANEGGCPPEETRSPAIAVRIMGSVLPGEGRWDVV